MRSSRSARPTGRPSRTTTDTADPANATDPHTRTRAAPTDMGTPIPIDDPGDPRLAVFRRNERGLANRSERRDPTGAGWFLAEGDLVVERALDAGCRPITALCDESAVGPLVERLVGDDRVEVFVGGEALRRMITGLGRVQPVVAVFERPARPSPDDLVRCSRRLVVVEAVDNPANIGSIVRNAAALGWDAMLLDRTSADPLARRSIRVAMGTVFTLPHARCTTDDELVELVRERGRDDGLVAALTPDPHAISIDELVGRLTSSTRTVVVGSERDGLSERLLAAATHRVRIPMSAGIDSLNAAAATAIGCHLLR